MEILSVGSQESNSFITRSNIECSIYPLRWCLFGFIRSNPYLSQILIGSDVILDNIGLHLRANFNYNWLEIAQPHVIWYHIRPMKLKRVLIKEALSWKGRSRNQNLVLYKIHERFRLVGFEIEFVFSNNLNFNFLWLWRTGFCLFVLFKMVNWVGWFWQEFDGVYGPAWHCIVGKSFGSFVTHSVGGFMYFSMAHKLYILLFKTTVQRAN